MGKVRVDIVEEIYNGEGVTKQKCRPHLGGSQIGAECERSVYLGYRWAKAPSFSGRMLRLFRRGHEEEAKLVEALKSVGIHVEEYDPETGEQWHVTIFPGFSGSLDGICVFEGEQHLLEFKTHNDKSFKSLKNKGVCEAKPQHFAQMQVYMGSSGLEKALYVAVNKNDDELYIEQVDYNEDIYNGLVDKAKRIMHGWSIPPKSFELGKRMSPCNFCEYKGICWEGEAADKNCRTCKHAKLSKDAEWQCNKHCIEMTEEEQRKGCDDYEAIGF